MKHVVMFSGGIGSWAAAKRVVAEHGTLETTLLFADTLIEDEDLYRFLEEAAAIDDRQTAQPPTTGQPIRQEVHDNE